MVPGGGAPEDGRFMRRALELAERGWGRTAPNPMVGAVVVQGGEVVGEGWHHEYGRPHAEVEALRAAGGAARGATMYVTLEPCSHFGQTPPCTQAVLDAGVGRLVYACRDPNPAAGGGGDVLREGGVVVDEGVEEEGARDLNAPFFHRFATEFERPWIHLKLALSLDARIADREGRSGWITGEEARGEVHRLRAGQDAVAVGVGTILADDPLLTVRGEVKPRVPVARIVFDRRLRTPLDSKLVRSVQESPVWIVCSPDLPESTREAFLDAGVRLVPAADLQAGLRAVREAGVESIFCEGGAELGASLLEADAVDRLTLFYAPLLLGPGGIPGFGEIASPRIAEVHRWRPLRTATFGADTLISLAR